mmetsp:Transcript_29367/g.54142  ORF Transcript_29367/g.54142 Transcript_29367/m.54142 type:complete len:85 (+) Transcript_29367:58-312(+)
MPNLSCAVSQTQHFVNAMSFHTAHMRIDCCSAEMASFARYADECHACHACPIRRTNSALRIQMLRRCSCTSFASTEHSKINLAQ